MVKVKKLPGCKDFDIIKTCTPVIGRPFMKAYFVRIDNVFIDSGNSNCSKSALRNYLTGLPKRDSWIVLNTHLHEDHCGNNGLIQRTLGAKVLVPDEPDITGDLSLFYRVFWGKPYKFDCSIIKDDIIITDAGRRIKVISSPGHTEAHKCYLLEDWNILVTGDAIPFPVRKAHCITGENYIITIENLKNLKKYIDDSAVFLTSHQGILPDPSMTIQKRIDNMEDVVTVVLKAWNDNFYDMAKTVESAFGRPGLLDRMLAPRLSHENTVRSIVSNYDNPSTSPERKK